MGFINHDTLDLTHLDISLTETYYTVKAECHINRGLLNGELIYRISSQYYIYASKDAYDGGKQPLKKEHITIELESLTGVEPIAELYAKLKIGLDHVIDA